MLVEPEIVSVKVYRRVVQGLWNVVRYDDLGQVVPLSEVVSSLPTREIYCTLEPKAPTRLRVVPDWQENF